MKKSLNQNSILIPGTLEFELHRASGQVKWSSGQVDNSAIVKLDVKKLKALLNYCAEARTRAEIQKFCNISSRDYFRKNILIPLLNNGQLKMTIPDKPNSQNQRYYSLGE